MIDDLMVGAFIIGAIVLSLCGLDMLLPGSTLGRRIDRWLEGPDDETDEELERMANGSKTEADRYERAYRETERRRIDRGQ